MNKEIVNKIVESYTGEKTDPNTVNELVFSVSYIDFQGKEGYKLVPEYFIYYLKCMNIDTVINQHVGYERYNCDGTVKDYHQYAVDFYCNGKKLEVEKNETIYLDLYEGSPISKRNDSSKIDLSTTYNQITYYEPDWKEIWNVHFTDLSNFNIEIRFNRDDRSGKRLALATDKLGNIEIYIDDKAKDFHRLHGRKTGKKYSINIGKEHCDVNKYIDAIASVINHDNEEEAKLFEMIIRDPRVYDWLNEALMKMPKSLDEVYAKLKKEIDDEYNARLEELQGLINRSQNGRHL